jgi:hypothetical protein
VAIIELNREFFEWSEGQRSDPESRFWLRSAYDALIWEQLLAKRRVVILAEAGSGKTEEMQAQARALTQAGRFAFYATVEDVGLAGLEEALSRADRVRFTAWRDSDQPAWFFIDSVDEAKLNRVRLETALRRIADGIEGAARRAHIILSGRHTDWEFQRDLKRLNEQLPIPTEQVVPPAPDANELLIRTIRHERRQESPPAPESASVVAMQALDPDRVRLFATAKGLPDVDTFIRQIEAGNLWSFARRPLDLDWLVQFWRKHRRLGSLTEMLETSLSECVKEPNPDRTRSDTLEAGRGLHALERIGAALVFGRTSTIAIPDSELTLSRENPPLELAKVLPDWSERDRISLMTRAVFDLATFGRVRLHNDNQAVVRAYLAARWLRRLHDGELSQSQLFDLLFADTYGVKVIRPSMRETVAWLALWDEGVAAEVVAREPWVLLTAGDPASLPVALRQTLLSDLVRQIAERDERLPLLDRDSLKRFSKPDLAPTIRRCWAAYSAHAEARDLLLRLIALGELADCMDLAEVAFAPDQSRHDQLFAGWALMAAGDAQMKRRYAEFIRVHRARLPRAVVWDAIKGLFPLYLGVDDFLAILALIDVTERDGGLGLDWEGPDLVAKLSAPAEVQRLLSGLLDQLGGNVGRFGELPNEREKAYFPIIGAAAYRLVVDSPEHEAPTLAIDAALRIGEDHRNVRTSRKAVGDLRAELRRTPARRRLAFWRAAARLTGHPVLRGRAVELPWEMGLLGWPSDLTAEDLDWLLADGPTRTAENERRLAINTALQLWHMTGSSPAVLARIESVAREDAAMMQAYVAGTQPRRKTAREIASERELESVRRRAAVERGKMDQSWIDFIADLKAKPHLLRELRSTTAEGADRRLFALWELLRAAQDDTQHYAIKSIEALEPIIGQELATAVQDGLSDHWRAWRPTLKSARQPDKRNQISTLDCMGIAGISIEANSRPTWAERLSSEEARLAASYATLEINGFPDWLTALALAKPQEVAAVLIGEIVAELQDPDPQTRRETLEDVARAAPAVQELMAPSLLVELECRPDLPPPALRPMLELLVRGLRHKLDRFEQRALTRFRTTTDIREESLYLGAAFHIDSATATDALWQNSAL